MKIFYFISVLLLTFNYTFSQIGGYAGNFTRMGFGSRGIGMGNAMSSIITGELNSYYNPAVLPFTEKRNADLSIGFLPFDRYINFLSYSQSVKPTAGLSIGIINASVRNIDIRDNDGYNIGYTSTSENQFYLAFANQLHPNFSLGLSVKVFYYNLYKSVSSTTVGFDFGVLTKITEYISLGFVLQDINSNYKWNTSTIYGQAGGQTVDKFPNLRRISISYKFPYQLGIFAFEFENSSVKSNMIRIGSEIFLHEYFLVRTGLDRWDIGGNDRGIKPTFGFSVNKQFDSWNPMISYAFVIEPFSIGGLHFLTLSVKF